MSEPVMKLEKEILFCPQALNL